MIVRLQIAVYRFDLRVENLRNCNDSLACLNANLKGLGPTVANIVGKKVACATATIHSETYEIKNT